MEHYNMKNIEYQIEELESTNYTEDSEYKRDKIFDNTYDEVDLDTSEINFKVDPSAQEKSYEYNLDEKIILEKVEAIFENENRFDRFKFPDESGNFKKMNKSDINEIYSFVTSKLPTDPKIEIFSVLSSIFDINSEKFYDSLSNTFKTGLINELKGRGYIKNRKSLF